MFIDTSALVAILTAEEDAAELDERLRNASSCQTSALVMLEATMVLSTRHKAEPLDVLETIMGFLLESNVIIVGITASDGREAVKAFTRYGKGRNPARLNLADCMSYACAKTRGLALLYKGEDFSRTDLAYRAP